MKKSTVAVAVTVIITVLLGTLYIGISISHKKGANSKSGISQSGENSAVSSQSGDISFGELKYTIENNKKITARYMKTGSTIKIYSIYPANDKEGYDISSDGSAAACIGSDKQIWVLFNDGTSKAVTPEKYGAIEKSAILKANPGYIWAEKPIFTGGGSIRFVSNLPETGNPLKKSIWQVSLTSGEMKKIYTLTSDSYKYLGNREDNKFMILDNNNIAAIDLTNGSVQNIDVKDKYILSMSPDGAELLYVKKDKNNLPDYSSLYIMDSYGSNSMKLPGIAGYTSTPEGLWYSDSSKYASIIKPLRGSGKDMIAVINFGEHANTISSYAPESDTKFPDNSKLRWGSDDSISVDIGDDIITVETH